MRACLFVLILAVLLAPAGADAKKKEVVGGPCAYEEFGGYCTVSGKDAAGKHLFTFVGVVHDEDVNLEKNTMMEGMSMKKGSMPCKLEFIRKGTCTPCVLSIGECGEQAWDLFRAGAKTKKKR
jgi:hypothetical protein